MLIMGGDVESTGLSIGVARVIEIACAIYCTDSKRVVSSYSTLLWEPDYPSSLPDALAAHKLETETLKKHGKHPTKVFQELMRYMDQCDAVIFHNGNNFDKPMLEHESFRYGTLLGQTLWLDSRTDIPYPPSTTSLRLVHLAADHQIYYPKAHSAVCDVDVMLQILSKYDIAEVMERGKSPLVEISAEVSYDQKSLAQARRYRWDKAKKKWIKSMKEFDLEKESKEAPFKIRRES